MNESFVYNPVQLPVDNLEDKFFTIVKDYDFIDGENNPRLYKENDHRILAKIKYKPNGQAKYLIKLDNSKKLYNPSSPLPENRNNKLLNQYGADGNSFKEVSKKVFDYYLIFLRTSNPSWIHNAEREDF